MKIGTRAFPISLGAIVIFASGAFALAACSSSSNDASTFVGGASDAVDASCADAVAFTCPQTVPAAGDSCNAPTACTTTQGSQTACAYLCANGQQQFVASCPSGQWVIFDVNDCNLNFDASVTDDAGDGE